MNEYIELMERTLSAWVKEYPVEWIEQAYKNTVDKYMAEIEPQESEGKDTDKCTYKETGCGSCKRQLDCPMNVDKAETEE